MNRSLRVRGLMVTAILAGAVGCFRAPDVSVDASGWGRERPSTTSVPPTSSHDEAKAELRKAYGEIEHLRKENEKLKRKNDELERKNDELKKKAGD
ncbi:MAG: hypothetical protein JXQ73_01715 [Phycisphaerae bacterium]|nr:hypothetical protein [Phycisphaerae bacterium]